MAVYKAYSYYVLSRDTRSSQTIHSLVNLHALWSNSLKTRLKRDVDPPSSMKLTIKHGSQLVGELVD